jgi:hypothetical protein
MLINYIKIINQNSIVGTSKHESLNLSVICTTLQFYWNQKKKYDKFIPKKKEKKKKRK